MRKKYLSALLFGALLVTSAGTFTSCKDYDDEINNLQEQIDVIKADLATLTETVKNLDGVKDMSFTDGKLVIETGSGKKVEVDIPSATGLAEIKLEGNVLYVNGEEAGKVEIPEGETVKVEVKDGKLYINDQVQDLEIGSKVVMVDNGDGTYTMTVDGKSYILPKGAATNISIKVVSGATNENYNYFTQLSHEGENAYVEKNISSANPGIVWGAAAKAVDWTGPKGKVAAGQLLVGQTSRIEVEVTPAATQLDLIDWKLVDTKGNAAPVVVTPVAAASMTEGTTGSRTVSANGRWYLSVAMDETVTAENMGSAFTSEESNKVYALQADGQIVSGYVYVVDTQKEAAEELGNTELGADLVEENVLINGVSATNTLVDKVLPIANSIELGYKNDYVYDYKFEIATADENDCDALGITLENNVLKGITNKAAGEKINFILTVLGVDGTEKTYSSSIELTVDDVEADATELPATAYTLSIDPDKQNDIIIDLGTTFSGLTASDAVSISAAEWTLEGYVQTDKPGTDNFILAAENNGSFSFSSGKSLGYYSDAACKDDSEIDFTDQDDSDNIKNIKFAKISFGSTNINTNAKPGTYNLILTLKDGNNEVKKVKVPVTVSAPAFSDIFTKSAAWKDGVASLVINSTGAANILQLYTTADGYSNTNLVVKFDPMTANESDYPVTSGSVTGNNQITFTAEAADKGSLLDVVAEVSYKVQGKENFTVKSGKFTIDLIDWFDEYTFANYANDAVTPITITTSDVTLNNYASKYGITLLYGTVKYPLAGIALANNVTPQGTDWTVTFDSNVGDGVKASVDDSGNIEIQALAVGEYTTNMYLTYKSLTAGGEQVTNTITVPVNVKIGK